jgi:hypothetical protein
MTRQIVAAYAGRSGIGTDPGWVMLWDDGTQTWTTRRKGEPYDTLFDFDKVVRVTKVEHWQRVTKSDALRFPHWVPDPKGASMDRPCCESVTIDNGRAPADFKPCDLKIKSDGLCGQHARFVERRRTRDRKETEREERSEAGRKIAKDAVKLAATVKLDDDRPVKVKPHYHVPFGSGMGHYTGEVKIHAEDLTAIIRRLQYLEEMTGGEL